MTAPLAENSNEWDDDVSDVSSVHNNSVVSTVPDKHGFFGGSQYCPDSIDPNDRKTVLRREKKWLLMLEDWQNYMDKHYKKVRERCRKGIPASIRPRAWLYLCGGKLLLDKHPYLYTDLLKKDGDPRWLDDIRKDLHRQFPDHEMFATQQGYGQQDLFDLLKAYSLLNPVVGYCQAQAPIAAFLLMHMPAEEAFWCFVSVCDKYLPGYFSQGMETIKIDGDILFGLLKKVAPEIHRHLKKQTIEPILYMTPWFLCVFIRTLPWDTLLRLWDMFLSEGVKIIFKMAIVLMKLSLHGKVKTSYAVMKKKHPTMYETLEALRNPPAEELRRENEIVNQILKLNLTDEDFDYEHKRQLRKRKSQQNRPNSNSTR